MRIDGSATELFTMVTKAFEKVGRPLKLAHKKVRVDVLCWCGSIRHSPQRLPRRRQPRQHECGCPDAKNATKGDYSRGPDATSRACLPSSWSLDLERGVY